MRFGVGSARRFALAIGGGAAALVLGACGASIQISTDWNQSLNFTQFHTWDFQKDTLPYSTFMQERIRGAISDALTSKGLTRTETNPDLVVVWRVQRSTETQVTTTGSSYGYGGGAWGGYYGRGYGAGGYTSGSSTSSVQQIPVGALTVAMFDPKVNQLVWRGEANAEITEGTTSQQAIHDVIQQLFAQFPPKPGQHPQGSF